MIKRKRKKSNVISIIILFTLLFFIVIVRKANSNEDNGSQRDPFYSPLWKLRIENEILRERYEKIPQKRATGLQVYDIGELNLVGIVATPLENKALIEAPDNKAFFLVEGDLIGKNEGVVEQITKQEVIINEIITDYLGNRRENVIRLKIEHIEDEKKLGK